MKYHPGGYGYLTASRYPGPGQCMVGSLTGAVASQRVTEAVSYTHLDVYKRQGLDTLVVHAVNDECQPLVGLLTSGAANALSIPPGEYGRKIKTQRN